MVCSIINPYRIADPMTYRILDWKYITSHLSQKNPKLRLRCHVGLFQLRRYIFFNPRICKSWDCPSIGTIGNGTHVCCTLDDCIPTAKCKCLQCMPFIHYFNWQNEKKQGFLFNDLNKFNWKTYMKLRLFSQNQKQLMWCLLLVFDEFFCTAVRALV